MSSWTYSWTSQHGADPGKDQFLLYSRARWEEMADGMPKSTIEILGLLRYRPNLIAWDAFSPDGEGPYFRSESLVEAIEVVEERYKRKGDGSRTNGNRIICMPGAVRPLHISQAEAGRQ